MARTDTTVSTGLGSYTMTVSSTKSFSVVYSSTRDSFVYLHRARLVGGQGSDKP